MKKVLVYSIVWRWDEFVPKMIESVLQQSYQNFVFYLFVSEDSREPIQNYVNKYPLLKEKIFLETAFALGDEEARLEMYQNLYLGKWCPYDYITAVDGDDTLALDFLKVQVNIIEKQQADISACSIRFHCYDREDFNRDVPEDIIIERPDFEQDYIKYFYLFRTVWGKLYARTLFDQDVFLDFPTATETGYHCTDSLIVLHFLQRANKLAITKEVGYHYYYQEGTSTFRFQKNREITYSVFYQRTIEFLSSITPEVSVENKKFLAEICGGGVAQNSEILFATSFSPQEKYEKFHKMMTCKESKENIHLVLGFHYRKLVVGYDSLLTFFQDGSIVLSQENKKKLYEIFLVIWWRYKGKIPFPVFETFLFDRLILEQFVLDETLSCKKEMILYRNKRKEEVDKIEKVLEFL